MNKKIFFIFIVLFLIILGGAGYFYFFKKTNQEKELSGFKTVDLGRGFSYYLTGSSYKVASGTTSGIFKTGQEADILLSGIDFNNTGGPLLFNHPGNIASDGKRLILADRNNNRVLIWNELPTQNKEPDLVLGQKDFIQNNPGTGLDQMNWPVGVATDGKRLLVADTYNDRILIWENFPTQNGQAADYALGNLDNSRPMDDNSKAITWPWAVWTDGTKLIVTSTGNGRVFIWNEFPENEKTLPDITLRLKDIFGTPRSIGSDGEHLIIGDHNAYNRTPGNFFWKNFPTKDNQKPDFFMADFIKPSMPQNGPPNVEKINFLRKVYAQNQPPPQLPQGQPLQTNPQQMGEIFWGATFTKEGRLLALSGNSRIGIWNKFPENENDFPDVIIGKSNVPNQKLKGYSFFDGDGSSMTLAGEKLYISLSNGNKIVGFYKIPEKSEAIPDFSVGSSDININTLETSFIMSNPVPVSDGKHLFVSSDFDRKLYVYKNLPDESGAKPDLVYNLPEGPWDNDLYNGKFVLAGKRGVYIWKESPIEPKLPDIILENKIGNIQFQEIKGVALDKKYFYLADAMAKKIYVWEGIPNENSNPKFILEADGITRLSSDGKYLVGTFTELPGGGDVKIYEIDKLSNSIKPISLVERLSGKMRFNLPQGAVVSRKMLIIGDTGFSRTEIWNNIEKAIEGNKPDIVWGYQGSEDMSIESIKPKIGKTDLFWPAVASYDGNYIWLGEFKFSERLLRFSPK